MNLSTQILVFQNTELTTISRNGQVWIRLAELANALYGKGGVKSDVPFDGGVRQLQSLFQRRADEFTSSMTTLVEHMTAGGKQMVRIFSLRGAHLLAMFARTPVAKAFRRWVLDILDQEVVRAQPAQAPSDQHAFLALKQAVALLVTRSRSASYPRIYRLLRERFGVDKVDQLAAEQLPQAVAFVHGLAAKWELLEPLALPAPAALIAATKENIERLCSDVEFLRSWWATFGTAVEQINPELASLICEHFFGAAATARHLVRDLALPSQQQYAGAYPWRADRVARRAYAIMNSGEVAP